MDNPPTPRSPVIASTVFYLHLRSSLGIEHKEDKINTEPPPPKKKRERERGGVSSSGRKSPQRPELPVYNYEQFFVGKANLIHSV